MFRLFATLSLSLIFGSSIYMSISGLISIFPDNPVIIIFLEVGLESGKVLITTHLFRNWEKIKTGQRLLCGFIIFPLIFLSASHMMGALFQDYQNSVKEDKIIELKKNALKKEENINQSLIDNISETIAPLPDKYVTRKTKLMDDAGYYQLKGRLVQIVQEKTNLDVKKLSLKSNSSPIAVIATFFEMNASYIVTVFIVFLVLMIELVTVALTMITSAAWMESKKSIEQFCRKPTSQPPLKVSSKTTQKISCLEQLKSLMQQYDLTVAQLAEITGRKKQKTCEEWLNGEKPTPKRAIIDVKSWIQTHSAADSNKKPRIRILNR